MLSYFVNNKIRLSLTQTSPNHALLQDFVWHKHRGRLSEFTEESCKSLKEDNEKYFILIEKKYVSLNDKNSDLEFLRQRIYLEFRNDDKGFSCLLLFNRQGINSDNQRIRTMASNAKNLFGSFLNFLKTQNHIVEYQEANGGKIIKPDKKEYLIYDDDTCWRIALYVCKKDAYFKQEKIISTMMKDFYKNIYLKFNDFYQKNYQNECI
jgi:hypothetical protein